MQTEYMIGIIVGVILVLGVTIAFLNTKEEMTGACMKKGVGLPKYYEFGKDKSLTKHVDRKFIDQLNVRWYYNWSKTIPFASNAEFIPMIWGKNSFGPITDSRYLLGFNEPDHPCQSNATVNEVITPYNIIYRNQQMMSEVFTAARRKFNHCSKTAGKAEFVMKPREPTLNDSKSFWTQIRDYKKITGSPACASDVLKPNSWFRRFHTAAANRYDFITIHKYHVIDPYKFIRYLQEVYKTFRKPIWVTEYAPQTYGESKSSPNKYTQAQIDKFIRVTSKWMNETPYIHRYAWHHSYVGRCALFDKDGNLTATGKTYASC